MTTKLLITLIILLEFATGSLWIRCQKLADKFYANGLDAQLKLEEAVRNDVGYSTVAARFFHNKINVYMTEFLNTYIQFWDIRFDVLFFSIVGFFGILCGFWYMLTNKKKTYKTWLLLVVLMVWPLIEIIRVPLPYWIRIIIILIPFYVFSLYGLWQFLKHHKLLAPVVIIVLIVISAWYLLVFQTEIFMNFCYN